MILKEKVEKAGVNIENFENNINKYFLTFLEG